MTSVYLCTDMSPETLARLEAAGISVSNFELGGTTYPSIQDLEGTERVLGGHFIRGDTEYSGVYALSMSRLTPTPPPSPSPEGPRRDAHGRFAPGTGAPSAPRPRPTHKVIIRSWNGGEGEDNKDNIKKAVEEILLPVVKRDVNIYVPHGRICHGDESGPFNILIWTTAGTEDTRGETPEEMWGTHVDCQDGSYAQTGMGEPIMANETYCAAELYDNNLYIHHDMVHHGTEDELNIFRHILEEAAKLMKEASKVSDGSDAWKAKSKKAFIELAVTASGSILKRLEGTVAENEKKVVEAQREIVRRLMEIKTCRQRIETYSKDEVEFRKRFEAEFEKLKGVEGVLKVGVRGGLIEVFTDTIYCQHEKTKNIHEIGKFKLVICLTGAQSPIRWLNLTHTPGGMNAPHVFGDGEACTGTAGSTFSVLIGNGDIAAAVTYAIKFVQSANTKDEIGQHLVNWPIYKKAEDIEKEGKKV